MVSNFGAMPENPETKGRDRNQGAMLENSNQNKWIESERDAGEHEIKGRDQIKAQCQRTRNKRKGSNLGAMLENPK